MGCGPRKTVHLITEAKSLRGSRKISQGSNQPEPERSPRHENTRETQFFTPPLVDPEENSAASSESSTCTLCLGDRDTQLGTSQRMTSIKDPAKAMALAAELMNDAACFRIEPLIP